MPPMPYKNWQEVVLKIQLNVKNNLIIVHEIKS